MTPLCKCGQQAVSLYRKKLLRELENQAVCQQCKLFSEGEVKQNKCFEHYTNVVVRWDLILMVSNDVMKELNKKFTPKGEDD